MSVCRFWWDGSDVYIYGGERGWECCGCKLSDGWFAADEDEEGDEEMVRHLMEHVRAGHVVPVYAFEAFGGQHPSPETADEAQAIWREANPKYSFMWDGSLLGEDS